MITNEDIVFLRKQVEKLRDENLNLKCELAFANGKVEAYEWFLQTRGYIKEGKEHKEVEEHKLRKLRNKRTGAILFAGAHNLDADPKLKDEWEYYDG